MDVFLYIILVDIILKLIIFCNVFVSIRHSFGKSLNFNVLKFEKLCNFNFLIFISESKLIFP